MKVIFNSIVAIIIFILSLSSLFFTNEILKFLSYKKSIYQKSLNHINELERIQGLSLDSFLKQEKIKRTITTKSATLYIFEKYGYELLYVKED
ncbi:hypothetical protein OSSY52_17920 [Tepiditoga spiralis]|uniref:Uncharacterized protein n=1 Tax=Tepiditoga spiralis TaxID=2108365 RepID=A0A7G1G5H0_9BACT|nr:hypothetical protein [Tepiditoga spiralis]BBE31651.1 hypothetical protein OSSY52_17920 [Tepiditoga spiralis]